MCRTRVLLIAPRRLEKCPYSKLKTGYISGEDFVSLIMQGKLICPNNSGMNYNFISQITRSKSCEISPADNADKLNIYPKKSLLNYQLCGSDSTESGSVIVGVERVSVTNRYTTWT